MDDSTPEPTPSPSQTQLVPAPPSSEGQLVPAAPSSQSQLVPAATGGPLAKQTAEKPVATSRPGRPLASDLFPGITDEARQKADNILYAGDLVRQYAAPMCLEATCGSAWKGAGELPFVGQHDQILRDSGRPADPVEVMLLEQIQLAFHHSLKLQGQALTANSLEATKIYINAACWLLAEFRRLTGALQNYRSPRRRGQFIVVRQQNLAGGNQQIALLDSAAPSSSMKLPENAANTELGSSKPAALSYQPAEALFAESKASGGRQEELVAARPVDGGKPRKTPRRRAKKSTLEALDGPKDV